jgi:hypothetical protein
VTERSFIVGVSGHRDLNESHEGPLGEAVTAFLREIAALLPDTEIRVMAGMAYGADLLAAESALELGLGVDAVLPVPLPDYATDFNTGSFRELNTLLRHPNVRCIELPLPRAGAGRPENYLNLARALQDNCDLLIALWDGGPWAGIGGTVDTVLRYLADEELPDAAPGPIVFADAREGRDSARRVADWIPTPRGGARAPSAAPCFLSRRDDGALLRWAHMPAALRTILDERNAQNR